MPQVDRSPVVLSTTPLLANATAYYPSRTGELRVANTFVINQIRAYLWTDRAGILYLQESEDGSTWTNLASIPVRASTFESFPLTTLSKRSYRWRYVNRSAAQSKFVLLHDRVAIGSVINVPNATTGTFTTLQNAATATGNGTNLAATGLATIVWAVNLAGSSTVTFEGTANNGDTWSAFSMTNLVTEATTSTTSASGLFQGDCTAFTAVRARISAWSAGTVSVYAVGIADPNQLLDGSALPNSIQLIAGYDGTTLRVVKTDSDGKLETATSYSEGAVVPDGDSLPNQVKVIAGYDGTHVRALKTDADGKLETTTSLTLDALEFNEGAVVADGGALPDVVKVIGGYDGTNVQAIKTTTDGEVVSVVRGKDLNYPNINVYRDVSLFDTGYAASLSITPVDLIKEGPIFHGNVSGNGNGTVVECENASTIAIEVWSQNMNFTVNFEGKLSTDDWRPLQMTNMSSGIVLTTTTTPGFYRASLAGILAVRARISDYVSGTAGIYGNLSSTPTETVASEEATAADNGTLPAKVKVIGGYDGSNVQAIKTTAAGEVVTILRGKRDSDNSYLNANVVGDLGPVGLATVPVNLIAEDIFHGNAMANGNGNALAYPTASTVIFEIYSNDMNFTVNFEIQYGTDAWRPMQAINAATGVVSTTATSAGAYRASLAGAERVRARVSNYVSGSAGIYASFSSVPTETLVPEDGSTADGGSLPAKVKVVGGYDGTNVQVLKTDSDGKLEVVASMSEEATVADDGALPAKVKVVAGYDGSNVQVLKTDSSGKLEVVTTVTEEATVADDGALPAKIKVVGGYDGSNVQVLKTDSSGKLEVVTTVTEEATVADNGALPAKVKVVGGYDGSNVQVLKTDANGKLEVVASVTEDATAADDGALPAKVKVVGGYDGSNVQVLKTDSSGKLDVTATVTEEAAVANAGAIPSKVKVIAGYDGSNVRAVKTDASGNLQTTVTSITEEATVTSGGTLPGKIKVIGGYDGSAVRVVKIDTSGNVGTYTTGHATTTATLQNAAAATANGSTLTTTGYNSVLFEVDGGSTWSGTVFFEASQDGTVWWPIVVYPLADNSTTNGATSLSTVVGADTVTDGLYQANVAAINNVRARITRSAGSITIKATASTAFTANKNPAVGVVGALIPQQAIQIGGRSGTNLTTSTVKTPLVQAAGSDALIATSETMGLNVLAFPHLYNGSTWDRAKGTSGSLNVSEYDGATAINYLMDTGDAYASLQRIKAVGKVAYNEATADRWRNNVYKTAIASASDSTNGKTSSTLTNYNGVGLAILLNVTARAGTGQLDSVYVEVKFGALSTYQKVYEWTGLAIIGATTKAYLIAPGAVSAGTWSAVAEGRVTRDYRIGTTATTSSGNTVTYSITVCEMV